jgi:hypothetical protein
MVVVVGGGGVHYSRRNVAARGANLTVDMTEVIP